MRINIKTSDFIYPYFAIEGKYRKESIKNFPGVYRFSLDRLLKDAAETKALGIDKILLFGIPAKKDDFAAAAWQEDNLIARAVKAIKKEFPDLVIITDVCLCAYTRHGHCGIIKDREQGTGDRGQRNLVVIENKETLKVLAKIALAHARAGADWVAPSAMARQQVFAIRKALNKNGYQKTKILGYSAKFASNFYGPFRNAADSAPKFGDRKGYQLNYSDSTVALKEIAQDINEGADMVMVKPALSYLDIIKEAKRRFNFPLAAYNTSGEYALVKYGARHGVLNEKKSVLEIITAIKRAGADMIITYHAKDIAKWIKEN